MRKLTTAIALLCLCVSTLMAQAPDWGTPDTLEHYSLGSGVTYTKIAYQKKPVILWYTTIDLSNPYTEIKQVQSNDRVPDVPRETVMSMSSRYTKPEHRVCVAFNHDFFSYDQGICIGVNVTDGEIPYGTGWGRSLLAVSADGVADVFYPQLAATVNLPDGSTPKFEFFNSSATTMPGNCFLFNQLNSRTLTEDGLYIKLKPLSRWLVNGEDIMCDVLEVSNTPMQTSSTTCVIYARNSRIADFEGKVKAGDRISISQKFIQNRFGNPLTNIIAGFHGYPSIAFEGKLHEGEYNDFENGREYEVSARVMAGHSEDGKTFYVATVEGGTPESPGVNCVDLANWMLAHGAWNVVNFDSGGSATIAVDHKMLNYPMRGSIRPVTDALLVVSIAPESEEVDSYSFITPSLYTTSISLNPLTLLSYNAYGKILEKGVQGFTYQCLPTDLGYVDSEGVFHASTLSGNGKIIATKDGKQATLNIYVAPVSDVRLKSDEILIDGNRIYPLDIEASSGTQTYALDPTAFVWRSNNPSCCDITDGTLKGLAEGEAEIEGTLDELTLQLKVIVEMASGEKVHETFDDLATWERKTSGTFTNMRFENTDLPFGWNDGINMLFDVNTGRSASISFPKEIRLYSLPDSMSIQLSIKDDLMKDAYFDFSSKTNSSFLKARFVPMAGVDSVYVISFMNDNLPLDITEYPLTLKNMTFYMKSGMQYSDSRISYRDLKAYYPGATEVGLQDVSAAVKKSWIEVSGDEAIVHYTTSKVGLATINVFTIDGMNVLSYTSNRLLPGSYQYRIPLYRLQPNNYIVTVAIDGKQEALRYTLY